MVRTQISLTGEQLAELREEARARRTSVVAIVREAVDAYLSRSSRDDAWDRALAAVGWVRSGVRDTSVNHDRYFAVR